MKKIMFVFLFTLIASGIFSQNGIIRELAGTVEIKRPGASDFVPARAGDSVSQDTIISTGFRSTALLEVGSVLLTVRPLTRLSLLEIRSSTGTEALNVNLQAGRVRVDVNPPAGTRADMQISSPVATASVRGTSFEFDTRNVRVSSGTVSFSGRRGWARQVGSGSSGSLENDGRAADPIVTRNRRLRPQPPVGTDTSSGASSGSASSYSIDLYIIPLYE